MIMDNPFKGSLSPSQVVSYFIIVFVFFPKGSPVLTGVPFKVPSVPSLFFVILPSLIPVFVGLAFEPFPRGRGYIYYSIYSPVSQGIRP
jgi:hypothetical protein